MEFYKTLSRLDPDGVTIEQARTLQELFSNFMANFKVDGKGVIPTREGARISQLRLALEKDLSTLINIDGDIDMVNVIGMLSKIKKSLPFRPDHGQLIGDDLTKADINPGYSYIGRLRDMNFPRQMID